MPCYTPNVGWRHVSTGAIQLGKQPPLGSLNHFRDGGSKWQLIRLPCNHCIGCNTNNAQAWAIRCAMELQQHDTAAVATLTYREEANPYTLDKDHLSAYIKRLRARNNTLLKFFACGEYGDLRKRPHYHAILYGLRETNHHIHQAWPHGNVYVDTVTPRAISYVAGYFNKKLDLSYREREREWVDPETGEVITWQPPFRLMSRGGRTGLGIGAAAKQFHKSWRDKSVWQGRTLPVPRYYHDAWQAAASDTEKQTLMGERIAATYERYDHPDWPIERLEAAHEIAKSKRKLTEAKRKLK